MIYIGKSVSQSNLMNAYGAIAGWLLKGLQGQQDVFLLSGYIVLLL